MTAWFIKFGLGSLFLLIVMTLLGQGGAHFYLLDLSNHFRFYYFIVVAAIVVMFLLLRAWKALVVSVLCLMFQGASIFPWYMGDAPSFKPDFKVLSFNVLTSNTHFSEVELWLNVINPDIIAFQEVDQQWLTAMKGLKKIYPYNHEMPRNDNFGLAIYSRFPIQKVQTPKLSIVPSLLTTIVIQEKPVHIFNLHTLPPVNSKNYKHRNQHLIGMAQVMKDLKPAIVLGDFNITMWSPVYQEVEALSGLKNARRGFGINATWPAHQPITIPIDHVLISQELKVAGLEIGPYLGSDHLPLLVGLSFN